MLLARALDADPCALDFVHGPRGKPALRRAGGTRFNVAHSGDLVLWALSQHDEVGVDVERIRPDLDWPPLAARFLGPHERAGLSALAPARRDEGFFACWTRKEAYLKATGLGLGIPLDSFSVSVDPDAPAALLQVDGDPGAPARWSLADVAVGPGYRACVAVPRPGATPVCHDADGLPL
jgi:4'-phosphopantetheinyl transferase